MKFPDWVDAGKRSKAAKGRARLKYAINKLAAEWTENSSLRQLALHVGITHATMSKSVVNGRFAANAAVKILRACPSGFDGLTIDFLMDPAGTI